MEHGTQKTHSGELKKELETRHVNMIAIGGTIGTGLFLASGGTVSEAGPGGALLTYAILGIMVYFLMTSLGEMAAFRSVSGVFEVYPSKFIDPAMGFAMGWVYWLGYSVTLAVELSASAILMKYWFPDTPGIIWSALFLAVIFGINYLSTKAYGESEYWFSMIKVAVVIVFIVVGILTVFGLIGGEFVGFKNFTYGEAPFVGGLSGMIGVFFIAGFSFMGTEFIAIAAAESKNPEKSIPQATRNVFWRILLFFIGVILIIGLIIPYDDPNLLQSDLEAVAMSPFTLLFQNAGMTIAAGVMNAVILTAILSAGISSMYVSTRMLYSLAKSHKAPRFLGKVNSRGVPTNALFGTAIMGAICFLSSLVGDGAIYYLLLDGSALLGFIAWLVIAASHYRFRRAFVIQGRSLNELKYRAKWFPFGPIFAFVLCSVIVLGFNYKDFVSGSIDWIKFFVTYSGGFVFLICYFGYKFVKKTKIIPLKEIDFDNL
ncbi:amino acid permease [Brevibacillus sp. NRS-1366]|uniref:amino acid permease n=1 Tax=Brevibacillus sp. NRS-1366 TaxID=3233899 RepID=UPI003D1C8AE8